MNINDYKNAASRIEPNPELKEVIMEKSMPRQKHSFSKKRFVPVLAAVVVCCVGVTAVFADEFNGFFRKSHNFKMAVTELDSSDPAYTDGTAEVAVLSAKKKVWSEAEVHAIFDNGRKIVDSGRFHGEDDDFFNENEDEKTGVWWEYEDGFQVRLDNGDISGYTKIPDYDYGFIDSMLVMHNNYEDELFPLTTLSTVDKDSAVAQADELMEKIGVSTNSKEIIALDAEHLNSVEKSFIKKDTREDIKGNPLPDWTSEQEVYYIRYYADVQGLPVSSRTIAVGNFYYADWWSSHGSYISVMVGKDGIVRFEANTIYETGDKVKDVSICSAAEAAEVIGNDYESNLAEHPVAVENMRLVYHTVPAEGGDYEMRPYWEFASNEEVSWYTEDYEKDSMDFFNTIFVDAETKEIVYDGNRGNSGIRN